MFEQRVLRLLGQAGQLLATVLDCSGRPFLLSEKSPGGVETFLAARHGPGGMTFVQEGLAPFD